MGQRFVAKVTVLVVASLILAGCAVGRGKATEAYTGEFREFDLFLFEVRASPESGHELHPGARADIWGWAPENVREKATVPGPTLRVREHDTVRVNFHIPAAPMAHTIHWHGIHVPWDQDGVPYVSQLPIGAKNFDGHGNVFTYEFTVKQSGTYWYHCHVDTAHHLDMGMYGALIVDPADPREHPPYDREEVLLLDEWDQSHSHQNLNAIHSAISRSGDPRVTANDMYSYIRDYLLMNEVYNDTIAAGALANRPGVRETRDWYPITYAPYFAEYDTFLINGKAFPLTQPMFIKTGETLRMRLINAGTQVHSMHLHGHYMYVTHKDGALVPLIRQLGADAAKLDTEQELAMYAQAVDTLLIGPGERYDLYVFGNNPGPWHFHDHIPINEANDYINPGGMMTMLCYEDNWPNAQKCLDGHMHNLHGGNFTSGSIVQFMDEYLRKLGGVAPVGGKGAAVPSSTSGAPSASVPTVGSSGPAQTSSSAGVPLPSLPAQHAH